MRLIPALAALALTVVLSGPSVAGEFNSVLDIGSVGPKWQALPGVDDQKHSLDDLSDDKVVVVVFTCNSCPYAVDVEDRLIQLANDYAGRDVSVVAINVNLAEEDLLPAMKERAADKNFPFAYLFDQSQQIAKDYGAKRSPEFFVLNQDRKVVYMGSFDDSPEGKDVKETYVRDAIEATLAGTAVTKLETISRGCLLRIKRSRR